LRNPQLVLGGAQLCELQAAEDWSGAYLVQRGGEAHVFERACRLTQRWL
jgi:hypothetical protein